MNIILGCEESQEVTKAFRERGHVAFSCDILPCSGGRPEWHLQCDVFDAIKSKKWDKAIFFPPCTYLCSSGLHWNKRVPGRQEKTEKALKFVRDLLNCGIPEIGLENPIGCISTRIFWYVGGENGPARYEVFPSNTIGIQPQIIQPWQFGHPESKATCLFLHNLPPLEPTDYADFKKYRCRCGYVFDADLGKYGCANCGAESGAAKPLWDNMTPSGQNKLGPSKDRAKIRSKTYPGIASAMAEQWG